MSNFAPQNEKSTMATQEEYAQMKAYSRIDGALVGVMWAVSFACMVAGFKNPSWSYASIIIGFALSPRVGLRHHDAALRHADTGRRATGLFPVS